MASSKKKAGKANPKTAPQQLVEMHTELKELIQQEAKHASVLFADMVGSTAFKEEHEALEALEKPYQHHLAVCEVVRGGPSGDRVINTTPLRRLKNRRVACRWQVRRAEERVGPFSGRPSAWTHRPYWESNQR